MVHKNLAYALEHTSMNCPPTRVSVGNFLALGMALWLGACADSPCPEGLTHAGGQCVSSDDMPDATAQETGGANAHVDAETPDAAPMPDGSSPDATDAAMPDGSSPDATDAAMPDGSSPDVADASDSTVPEMMDATPPDPCLTAACGDNGECVVEDNTAHCNCLRGYIKGALGCERDECQALTEEDGPACGANASCEDPTAKAEDFECSCNEGFFSCEGEEDAEPGCETNLQDNADHCGACGYACAGDLNCIEGKCEQAADRLVLGLINTCLLSNESDGTYEMACAGANARNILYRGEGNTGPYPTPEPILGIMGSPKVRDIGLGAGHICVIPSSGNSVHCWGKNDLKQTGSANIDASSETISQVGLSGVVELALGAVHSCALTADGQVYCWGFAVDLRLGRDYNSDPTVAPPIISVAKALPVPNLGQVAHIAAGLSSTCALGHSGAVNCWGALHDEIQPSSDAGYLPTPITDTDGQPIDAEQVAVGGPLVFDIRLQFPTHCARLKTGRVACWGQTYFGLVGGDETVPMSKSVATDIGLRNIIDVSVGGHGACAVDSGGDLYCWGSKDLISNGTKACSPESSPDDVCHEVVPPTLYDVHDVVDVEVGQGHACARRRNGEVVCWGNNVSGQLGIGSVANDATPVAPISLPNYP